MTQRMLDVIEQAQRAQAQLARSSARETMRVHASLSLLRCAVNTLNVNSFDEYMSEASMMLSASELSDLHNCLTYIVEIVENVQAKQASKISECIS